jgi:peroxiredoxin Q/BCP
MKTKKIYWLGFVLVLSFLMAACGGAAQTPQTEEPIPDEIVITEQPPSTEVVEQEVVTPTVAAEVLETEQPTNSVEELAPADSTGFESPIKVATDFTLPDGDGNMVSLADELQENEQVVVVFYYGSSCLPCMAQLTEIENDHARYEEEGAQVIAIAGQQQNGALHSAQLTDAQFPILADTEHTVADAFGVLENGGYSTPSVFIINQDRQIVWSKISHIEGSGCGKNRVPSQTILDNLG